MSVSETPSLSPIALAALRQELRDAAAELNADSDVLGKPISTLDVALKQLNLGVATWVEIEGHDDRNTGAFWSQDLGYAKVNAKWGIALRQRRGNERYEDYESEVWLFNDGPRTLRLKAVEKLPTLLQALIMAAKDTSAKIKQKVGYVQALADAFVAPKPATPKK